MKGRRIRGAYQQVLLGLMGLLFVCSVGSLQAQTDVVTTATTPFVGGEYPMHPTNPCGSRDNPCGISTIEQLSAIRHHLGDSFVLVNDLTMPASTNYDVTTGNTGFMPIGGLGGGNLIGANQVGRFGGNAGGPGAAQLDGAGFRITNFRIGSTDDEAIQGEGLFAAIGRDGVVRDLTFVSPVIDLDVRTGNPETYYVGVIAGLNGGHILNCHIVNPRITTRADDVFAGGGDGDVDASLVGGIAGRVRGGVSGIRIRGLVRDCSVTYTTGSNVGITNTISISGADRREYVGGLVGEVYGGSVVSSRSTVNVQGADYAGGLAGNIRNNGRLEDCYVGIGGGNRRPVIRTAGNNNNSYAAGLVARMDDTGSRLSSCYTEANIGYNGSPLRGSHAGLMGVLLGGTLENCYVAPGVTLGQVGGGTSAGMVLRVGSSDAPVLQNCYSAAGFSSISNGSEYLFADLLTQSYTVQNLYFLRQGRSIGINPFVVHPTLDRRIGTGTRVESNISVRTAAQLSCPTAPDATCSGATTYVTWDDDVWVFGSTSQNPSLKLRPVITFPQPQSPRIVSDVGAGAPLDPMATSTSGEAVVYRVDPAAARIMGPTIPTDRIAFIGIGDITITASVPTGNAQYKPSDILDEVSRSIFLNSGDQQIINSPTGDRIDVAFAEGTPEVIPMDASNVATSATSGLPLRYRLATTTPAQPANVIGITQGTASVTGMNVGTRDTLRIIGGGTVQIIIDQLGDNEGVNNIIFGRATNPATVTITVSPINQTITVTDVAAGADITGGTIGVDYAPGDPTHTYTIVTSSGLSTALTLASPMRHGTNPTQNADGTSVGSGDIVEISPTPLNSGATATLTVKGAGTIQWTVTQAGNASYNAVSSVIAVTVNQISQTILNNAITLKDAVDATVSSVNDGETIDLLYMPGGPRYAVEVMSEVASDPVFLDYGDANAEAHNALRYAPGDGPMVDPAVSVQPNDVAETEASGTAVTGANIVQVNAGGRVTLTFTKPGLDNYNDYTGSLILDIARATRSIIFRVGNNLHDASATDIYSRTVAGRDSLVSVFTPSNTINLEAALSTNPTNFTPSPFVGGNNITFGLDNAMRHGATPTRNSADGSLVTNADIGGVSLVGSLNVFFESGAGRIDIAAVRLSTRNYHASRDTIHVRLDKADQTINVLNSLNVNVNSGITLTFAPGDPTHDFEVTTGSGLDADLSLTNPLRHDGTTAINSDILSSPTSVDSGDDATLTLAGAGTINWVIVQAGSDNYNSVSRTVSVTVDKATPVIVFTDVGGDVSPATPSITDGLQLVYMSGSPTYTLGTTVRVGGADVSSPDVMIDFQGGDPGSAVATLAGNVLTLVGAGGGTSFTVRATRDEDFNYNAALAVDLVVEFRRATQTITFQDVTSSGGFSQNPTSGLTLAWDARTYTLAATASSSNAVTFAESNEASLEVPGTTLGAPGVVTLSGTSMTLERSGTATITATQAGGDDYMSASAIFVVTVNRAVGSLSITGLFDSGGTQVGDASSATVIFVSGASYELRFVPGMSTGAVSHDVTQGGGLVTVAGTSPRTIALVANGAVAITLTQAQDNRYNEITTSAFALTIQSGMQTVNSETLTLGPDTFTAQMDTIKIDFDPFNTTAYTFAIDVAQAGVPEMPVINSLSRNMTFDNTGTLGTSSDNVVTFSGNSVTIVRAGTVVLNYTNQPGTSPYMELSSSVVLQVDRAPLVLGITDLYDGGTSTTVTTPDGSGNIVFAYPGGSPTYILRMTLASSSMNVAASALLLNVLEVATSAPMRFAEANNTLMTDAGVGVDDIAVITGSTVDRAVEVKRAGRITLTVTAGGRNFAPVSNTFNLQINKGSPALMITGAANTGVPSGTSVGSPVNVVLTTTTGSDAEVTYAITTTSTTPTTFPNDVLLAPTTTSGAGMVTISIIGELDPSGTATIDVTATQAENENWQAGAMRTHRVSANADLSSQTIAVALGDDTATPTFTTITGNTAAGTYPYGTSYRLEYSATSALTVALPTIPTTGVGSGAVIQRIDDTHARLIMSSGTQTAVLTFVQGGGMNGGVDYAEVTRTITFTTAKAAPPAIVYGLSGGLTESSSVVSGTYDADDVNDVKISVSVTSLAGINGVTFPPPDVTVTIDESSRTHPAGVTAPGGHAVATFVAGSVSMIRITGAGNAVGLSASTVMSHDDYTVLTETRTLNIERATQTITFDGSTPTTRRFDEGDFTLVATSDASLTPVTFGTVDNSVVRLSGTDNAEVALVAADMSVVITATQAGTVNYMPGTATHTLNTEQGNQAIDFQGIRERGRTQPTDIIAPNGSGDIRSIYAVGAKYKLLAPAGSGLSTTFALGATTPANAARLLVGDTVEILIADPNLAIVIVASQTGDANWNAATDEQVTLREGRGTQMITFDDIARTFGDPEFGLSITVSPDNGLAITYAIAAMGQRVDDSGNPTGAQIASNMIATRSGDRITIVGAGQVELTVNVAGSVNVFPATATATLTISKATQTITFDGSTPTTRRFDEGGFTLVATSDASLTPVTFSTADNSVVMLSGADNANVELVAADMSVVITATQAGTINYMPGTATHTLNTEQGNHAITIGGIIEVDATTGAATGTLLAPSSGTITSVFRTNAVFELRATSSATITPPFVVSFDKTESTETSIEVTMMRRTSDGVMIPVVRILSQDPAFSVGITAMQGGDGNWNAAPNMELTLTESRGTQVITFADVDKVFGDPAFPLSITVAPDRSLAISYTIAAMGERVDDDGNGNGTMVTGNLIATEAGGTVTIVGAGIVEVTATVAGNDLVFPAAPVTATLTVSKATQTITLGGIIEVDASSGATTGTLLAPSSGTISSVFRTSEVFELRATSTSGLSVGFATGADAAVATVGMLLRTGDGVNIPVVTITRGASDFSIVVATSQGGDMNWKPAMNEDLTLTESRGTQVITFADVDKVFGDPAFPLSITVTPDRSLAISYTIAAMGERVDDDGNGTGTMVTGDLIATEAGGTVTIVGAGIVEVTANVMGDEFVFPAEPVTATLTVSKATQTITIGGIIEVDASNGAATGTLLAPSSGTISSVFRTSEVFELRATSTSGLSVGFATGADAGVATVGMLLRTGDGVNIPIVTIVREASDFSIVVATSQGGDMNWKPAANEDLTLTESRGTQVITFADVDKAFGDAAFPLSITVTPDRSLSISYTIAAMGERVDDDGNGNGTMVAGNLIATEAGGTVTIVGAGIVEVTANVMGDEFVFPAEPVTATLTVSKAPQTITIGGIIEVDASSGAATGTLLAPSSGTISSVFRTSEVFELRATSTSGLPVAFATGADAGVATVGMLLRTGDGVNIPVVTIAREASDFSIVVATSQGGDVNWKAATNEDLTLTESRAVQTITFADVDKVFGDADFPLSIMASPDRNPPITYTIAAMGERVDDSGNGNGTMVGGDVIATVSGTTVTIEGAGIVEMTASVGGNDLVFPAAPVTATLTVSKAPQTITLDHVNQISPSQRIDVTAADPMVIELPYRVGNRYELVEEIPESGLRLTYSSSDSDIIRVEGMLDTNSDTLVVESSDSSTPVVITAMQGGNENWLPAPAFMLTLDESRPEQTLTFTPDPPFGTVPVLDGVGNPSMLPPFTVSAQSGEPVLLTRASGVNHLGEDVAEADLDELMTFVESAPGSAGEKTVTLTVHGGGSIDLVATHFGNDSYRFVRVMHTLTITRLDQEITFMADPLPDKTFEDPPFVLRLSADSDEILAVALSNGKAHDDAPRPAAEIASVEEISTTTLGGGFRTSVRIAILGAGSVELTATHAGNSLYNMTSKMSVLRIARAPQTITFSTPHAMTFEDPPFEVRAAGGGSGNPVVFSVPEGNGVLTLSGTRATIVGAGRVDISARQAGNQDYLPAPTPPMLPVACRILVDRAAQAIAFEPLPMKTELDPPFMLMAVGGNSDQPVRFSAPADNDVISIMGNVVTLLGSGEVDITATQDGNGSYYAAEAVVQALRVALVLGADGEVVGEVYAYPNPTKDYLYISTTEEKTIRVYDASGREVSVPLLRGGVDLRLCATGVYIVELDFPHHKTARFRVWKH